MRKLLVVMALLAFVCAFNSNLIADENDVVINEIMYNFWDDYDPDNEDIWFEYVELYNNGPDSVDLSGWWFRDGIDFVFPTDSYILPEDYVLVAVLPDTVIDYYSLDANKVYGPFTGALSNGGEDVIIVNASDVAIDSVDYDDGGGWPTAPDGDGPSLELVCPDYDNNIPESWAASTDYGTPLAINSSYSCGNQPPVIANITQTPEYPGVSESVDVCADITDADGTVNNADLYYDAGAGYMTVVMSNTSGDTWCGTIPGQADGTTVEYYITAWDDAGDSSSTSTYSYYVTDITYNFGDVICTEIMYSPTGSDTYYEWIELLNVSGGIIDMSFWSVLDNDDNHTPFVFPEGTTIGVDEIIIVSSDADSFMVRYPDVTCNVYGDITTLGFNNSGDMVRVYDAAGATIDSIAYENGVNDWPSTGSSGPSIELIDITFDRNLGTSWAPSPLEYGDPCNLYEGVQPIEVSIWDIQYATEQGSSPDCYPSTYNDSNVTTEGVVTAIVQGTYPNFYIQHPDSSAWNGVFVYDSNVEPTIGDYVSLTGLVDEYYGLTELKNLSDWTVESSGNPLPDTLMIQTADLAGGCGLEAEQYEGVLCVIECATVLDTAGYGSYWIMDDSGDSCKTDDELYKYGDDQPEIIVGNTYTFVGIVDYNYSEYKLNPRFAADVTLCEEIPCCDVDMVPDDDPVIVEPGGRFGLTGFIANPTADPIVTDVWGGVLYQGNFYQQFSFPNISLNPGQFISAHTWQNVPGFAPQGTYGYIAYCGDRPDVKCDSAEFEFTVVGARLANGADEWFIEGEFFGSEIIPVEYGLNNSYPNPFNASTTISFELPEAGNVNLEVYNLMGQKVATLVNGHKDAGIHNVTWDASQQSSGVYFYRLSAGEKVFTKRMTLLK
ncbi:MAG: T9SS type A sorting domain-containing protein [candidate division Zixibacteria bacterium]|nr:T9SS type A sorting domain-containing protein [candidate division Zixibacteria bacterium]